MFISILDIYGTDFFTFWLDLRMLSMDCWCLVFMVYCNLLLLCYLLKEDDIGSVEFPDLEKEESKENVVSVKSRRGRCGYSDSFSDEGKLPFFFPSFCFWG